MENQTKPEDVRAEVLRLRAIVEELDRKLAEKTADRFRGVDGKRLAEVTAAAIETGDVSKLLEISDAEQDEKR